MYPPSEPEAVFSKTKRTFIVLVVSGFCLFTPVSVSAVDCRTADGYTDTNFNSQQEVEDLVVTCARDNQTTTISDFYTKRLEPYFRASSNLVYHLIGSASPIRKLERDISSLDRYLNDNERKVMAEILDLTQLKDDLDYQRARQMVLKGWLFIHIPLTFSLLILLLLHIFVVYGFRGNLP